MGAEASSRLSTVRYDATQSDAATSRTSDAGGGGGGGQHATDFPNICRREWEAPAWTLLHQCGLDRWKDGHAGNVDTQLINRS